MDPIKIPARVIGLHYNEGSNSYTITVSPLATGKHSLFSEDGLRITCPPSGYELPGVPSNVMIEITPRTDR